MINPRVRFDCVCEVSWFTSKIRQVYYIPIVNRLHYSASPTESGVGRVVKYIYCVLPRNALERIFSHQTPPGVSRIIPIRQGISNSLLCPGRFWNGAQSEVPSPGPPEQPEWYQSWRSDHHSPRERLFPGAALLYRPMSFGSNPVAFGLGV